jgi:hypothetical protein
MWIRKHKKELPYEAAFDLMADYMTPYEIDKLRNKDKVALEVIDKLIYNQQPKKKPKPKKR